MHIRRQAKIRGNHIVDRNRGLVREKKNPTPGTICRLVGKAFEPITADVSNIKRRDRAQLRLLQTSHMARRVRKCLMHSVFAILVIQTPHIPAQDIDQLF
jgi:hypothetical protein